MLCGYYCFKLFKSLDIYFSHTLTARSAKFCFLCKTNHRSFITVGRRPFLVFFYFVMTQCFVMENHSFSLIFCAGPFKNELTDFFFFFPWVPPSFKMAQMKHPLQGSQEERRQLWPHSVSPTDSCALSLAPGVLLHVILCPRVALLGSVSCHLTSHPRTFKSLHPPSVSTHARCIIYSTGKKSESIIRSVLSGSW